MRTTQYFRLLVNAILGLALGAVAAEGPSTFKVSEFTFTRPAGWEPVDVSASPMRKAQFKVPGKEGNQGADVVFYYFGQSGAGGTQANVDRWFSQFQEPKDKINAKSENVTIGKRKVTYVQAEGTYMSGMPGEARTAQPNSMLLGAILESAEGSVFIKMTGPARLIKTSEETFKKMVRSGCE